MKRTSLTTAVIAGIAGVAGISNMASAVYLNNDGLGQVLIYPYYTVNNDNITLLSVVNTTDQSKAVKVRFLESLNSAEVLDFNLYLSPFDVWTAGVASDGGTGAVTRVLIESEDENGDRWTTIGVSPNIIDASFQALMDSVIYKLVKSGAPA